MCSVNVQHDCATSLCTVSSESRIQQERTTTTRKQMVVTHSPASRYILNTNSIHNYRHVLPLVPHELCRPDSMVSNPDEVRRQASNHIREKAKAVAGNTSAPSSFNPAPAPNDPGPPSIETSAHTRNSMHGQGPAIAIPAFERKAPSGKGKRKTNSKSTAKKTRKVENYFDHYFPMLISS